MAKPRPGLDWLSPEQEVEPTVASVCCSKSPRSQPACSWEAESLYESGGVDASSWTPLVAG